MAISKKNCDDVRLGMYEIFGKHPKMNGFCSDGGYHSISLIVPEIRASQFRQLVRLTAKVHNSFSISKGNGGIQLLFS